MELITSKTKEDFRVYLGEPSSFENFSKIPEIVQHTYLISFFDHVGIYVNTMCSDSRWIPVCENMMSYKYISRNKALTHALQEANHLYNQRFENIISEHLKQNNEK